MRLRWRHSVIVVTVGLAAARGAGRSTGVVVDRKRFEASGRPPGMPRRREVLAATASTATAALAAAGLAGCISDPGRRCRGTTVRLSLTPTDEVEDPLSLERESLSRAADAVVETAVGGEHVENCVVWDGDPGPSAGLREVGERLEAHLGIDLVGRREPVRTDAVRAGQSYRLTLAFEG